MVLFLRKQLITFTCGRQPACPFILFLLSMEILKMFIWHLKCRGGREHARKGLLLWCHLLPSSFKKSKDLRPKRYGLNAVKRGVKPEKACFLSLKKCIHSLFRVVIWMCTPTWKALQGYSVRNNSVLLPCSPPATKFLYQR